MVLFGVFMADFFRWKCQIAPKKINPYFNTFWEFYAELHFISKVVSNSDFQDEKRSYGMNQKKRCRFRFIS